MERAIASSLRAIGLCSMVASVFALLVPACGRSALDDELIFVDGSAGNGGSAVGGGGFGGSFGGFGGSGAFGGSVTGGVGGTSVGGSSGFGGVAGQPGCPGPCDGCCDAAGQCYTGDDVNACGKGGVQCLDCGEIGFDCQAGKCEGTAPTCDSTTCDGCCDASGACKFGTTTDACGDNGAVCVNCALTNQGCVSGACQGTPPSCGPSNCSGCCDAAGKCQPGDVNAACGEDGVECAACSSPAKCSQPGSYCAYLPTCGPTTCPEGCCDPSGTCLDGRKDVACGTVGAACKDCTTTGLACAPQGFCYDGPHCGPDNCAGCCDATGVCRPGSANVNCGQFGKLCDNCSAKFQTCAGQVCTTGTNCPAGFAGCAPDVATPPAVTTKSCNQAQLTTMASACQGQDNPNCGDAFEDLLGSDVGCYDCLLQFATDLAYVRCLAKFLTPTCNHSLTCALQCSQTACGDCPAPEEDECSDEVFGQGGICRPYINGYFCAQAALNGPAAFCEFANDDVGLWLWNVGNYYCGGG